jgi:hypothetical protein
MEIVGYGHVLQIFILACAGEVEVLCSASVSLNCKSHSMAYVAVNYMRLLPA